MLFRLIVFILILLLNIFNESKVVNAQTNSLYNGLRVSASKFVNSSGQQIKLYGINRSGAEFACIQGNGIFEGAVDANAVNAMKSWKGLNTVRVPLNEGCWLNVNTSGLPSQNLGANYQNAIKSYVERLNNAGLIVILDLHWTGAGTKRASEQQPTLNRDHSVEFWRQVSNVNTFKNNPMAIFDLHNEPFPDNNQDTVAAWRCWRDGGTCPGINYQAAGMQEVVNAIRQTGASNILLLGGVRYAGSLSRWLEYKPTDPQNNIAAAWHFYSFTGCSTTTCWDNDNKIKATAQQYPVITGEFGADCNSTSFVSNLANYMDSIGGSGYMGWTWNIWGQCHDLITNYSTGNPSSNWGQWLKNRFANQAVITPVQVSPTAVISKVPTATSPAGGATTLNFNLLLHGIGKAGDNVSPGVSGNLNPMRKQRAIDISISNVNNQVVLTKQSNINFSSNIGSFLGAVDVGNISTGLYTITLKSSQYLRKSISGIIQIQNGQQISIPLTELVTGDINNDNTISVLDYNLLLDCFADLGQARNCKDTNKKLMSDLNDDGSVNQFDYNLFLRELSIQAGQ